MEIDFNPASPYIMHIDLNSCFATIEQQANPFLRGKPMAVAAYNSPNGCILAASVEAKTYGVKTGMRVKDGKALCPALIVRSPDPWKYRNVHLKFRKLFSEYTNDFNPKSIDEFVLNLQGYPKLRNASILEVAEEIRRRIKKEIGDWLMVSIGISTNRYLAKVACGIKKPNGLEFITKENFSEVYSNLRLTDLTYIKAGNAARLSMSGIFSVTDFYNSDIRKLKGALRSIAGYYWYMRLRGWEIDDVVFGRRTYGNSYSLPKPLVTPRELAPILAKLVTKTSARIRKAGYKAKGVHLAISYRDGHYWHKGKLVSRVLYATQDIYKELFDLLHLANGKTPVRNLAISVFNLSKSEDLQLELFSNEERKYAQTAFMDKVNQRWGDYVLMPGRMADTGDYIPDRIAFGGVKELEEFTLGESTVE